MYMYIATTMYKNQNEFKDGRSYFTLRKKGKFHYILGPIPCMFIFFPTPAALIPPAGLLFLFLSSAGQYMYQSPCTFLLCQ